MNKEELRQLLQEILQENRAVPVKLARLPQISLSAENRLHIGNGAHKVYTKDLFSLQESPRLGCGVMEMEDTTFPWQLNYDEIDYVISGELTVYCGETAVTAREGEVLLIPKGSAIRFSAKSHTRFLYVTYPADWQSQ